MRLYHFPVAPNPTKVRLYVYEKGIEIDEVRVDLRKGEQTTPKHLERNPFGRLPVLELDDGSHLIESLAIIEYLEELHPTPPMIGRDAAERARVRSLERVADLGVLLPIGRIIHATRSPLGLPPVPAIAENERRQLPRALAYLDAQLADRPFLAGARPTIADCTLCAALGFARFGEVEIDPGYRHLGRWSAEFGERPSVKRL